MNTIAIWYEPNDNSEEVNKLEVELDIHVNFWKLRKKWGLHIKNWFPGSDFLLDFGFMISDLSKVKNFNVHFPFKIDKGSLEDLGKKLNNKEQKLVNSIFNENYCSHNSGDKPKQRTIQDKEGKHLFNIYSIDFKETDDFTIINDRYEGTTLAIHTSNINISSECKKYYFRIRLTGKALLEFIRKHEPKNRFFQSAFTSTDSIDFRINEKRNYNDSLAEEIAKFNLFQINKVHFLLMRNAPDDVIADHLKINCRELEPELWGDYVGEKYKLQNVIAYHWFEKALKEEKDKKKYIESFNTLVKVKFHKSNIITIILYLFVIGALSVMFNLASSYLKDCIDSRGNNKIEQSTILSKDKKSFSDDLSNDKVIIKADQDENSANK